MEKEAENLTLASERKTRAIAHEEEIKTFLKRLQFEDINGASDAFSIGGVQVDVCGGHEDNSLLIIECTMKKTLGKKPLRDKISELRGKIEPLKRGLRSHQTYKKYKKYHFLLAVKNIEVRPEDREYANQDPRIYLCDDNFFDYYDDLYSKIREYAKYNLLGEIGVRPAQQNALQIPASVTTFGKIKMYLFFIDPKLLLEVSYVARRDSRNERFYQRIINKERLDKISTYINNDNILPNNIIIAFGDNVKKHIQFHENPSSYSFKQQLSQCGVKFGVLEFPRDYRSCWIIDGQHRLYAFANDIKKPTNMPVVAFEDLNIEKQCKIFLDINKFQKPVNADLVWDLNGDMIPSETDGIISNVVKGLNDDKDSPLYHKIYIPSKGIKKRNDLLKMAGLCLALKRMRLASENTFSKTKNPFFDENHEARVRRLTKALIVYFSCLRDVLKNDWDNKNGFLSTDGAYGVFIRLFERVVSRCKDKKYPESGDYFKYLNPLKDLFNEQYSSAEDLKKLRLSISSEGGKDNQTDHFILYIKEKTRDVLFGGDVELFGMREFVDLEKRFKILIKTLLDDGSVHDWLKEKIPEEIYGRITKRFISNGQKDDEKLFLQLTLGECRNIFRIHKELFFPIFVGNEDGFHSDAAFEVALEHISKMRNTQYSHESGLKKKADDDILFKTYLSKINKCLEGALEEPEKNAEEDEVDNE